VNNHQALVTVATIALMTSAVYAVSPNDLFQCDPFLDKSRASFEACLKTYGASDEEARLSATYLIQHRRALDRVMDKIGIRGGERYFVYRPDGKLVDHVDPDALSADEEKCVDDDFSTADECLAHLGWRFIEKPH
jgi:hypothetical protein